MIGRILSAKYEIQQEIAPGGMGVVYRGFDKNLKRDIAIKVLHPHFSRDPAFAKKFLREAQAMARLRHINIMGVYDVGEDQGDNYIVMELFLGKDLKHYMEEQGLLPLQTALGFTIKMIDALEYLHGKGVVHRDIKPSNVMIGEGNELKITDFGIATLDEPSVTAATSIMGTPEYMSPEQARGELGTTRSDLYSTAMVLYEMLTGKTPYKGLPGPTIAGKLALDPTEPMLEFPFGVPEDIQKLIRNLLSKKPQGRISDTSQIRTILQEHLKGKWPSKRGNPPDDREKTQPMEAGAKTVRLTPLSKGTIGLSKGETGGGQRSGPRSPPKEKIQPAAVGSLSNNRKRKNYFPLATGLTVILLLGFGIYMGSEWWTTKPPTDNHQRASAAIKDLQEIKQKIDQAEDRQTKEATTLTTAGQKLKTELKMLSENPRKEGSHQEFARLRKNWQVFQEDVVTFQTDLATTKQQLTDQIQKAVGQAQALPQDSLDNMRRRNLNMIMQEVQTAEEHWITEIAAYQEATTTQQSIIQRSLEQAESAIHQEGETRLADAVQELKDVQQEIQMLHASQTQRAEDLTKEGKALKLKVQSVAETLDKKNSKENLEAVERKLDQLDENLESYEGDVTNFQSTLKAQEEALVNKSKRAVEQSSTLHQSVSDLGKQGEFTAAMQQMQTVRDQLLSDNVIQEKAVKDTLLEVRIDISEAKANLNNLKKEVSLPPASEEDLFHKAQKSLKTVQATYQAEVIRTQQTNDDFLKDYDSLLLQIEHIQSRKGEKNLKKWINPLVKQFESFQEQIIHEQDRQQKLDQSAVAALMQTEKVLNGTLDDSQRKQLEQARQRVETVKAEVENLHSSQATRWEEQLNTLRAKLNTLDVDVAQTTSSL